MLVEAAMKGISGNDRTPISSEMDSQRERILELARACRLDFRGTETEREELVDLRSEVAIWQATLEELQASGSWSTPKVERMLNAAELKARVWRARVRAEKPIPEEAPQIIPEDEQLDVDELLGTRPSVQVIDRVIRVLVELRDAWVAATVRFAEAVAADSSSLCESIERCRDVVDFNIP